MRRIGLGLGLDLPWGGPVGFVSSPPGVTGRTARFLSRHGTRFQAMFGSWQPRSRSKLDPRDYVPAWDDLWARLPSGTHRALHHTALNLASPEPYDRGRLLALTEALVERHGLRWINEDLGLWSLGGKSLPYPLPPYLTERGIAVCVRNIAQVRRSLSVPLRVEFPGFGEGSAPTRGPLDAYDHFRRVIEESGVDCTLDVAHLLGWRWSRGHRGGALFDEIDRLPLRSTVEIHLSGCAVVGDKLYDAHHGVLIPEQLQMLDLLLERCPNLQLVTFEDPRFDEEGELVPRCAESLRQVEARVLSWAKSPPRPVPAPIPELYRAPEDFALDPEHEAYVSGLTRGTEPELADAARSLARHVARRKYGGGRSLRELFPETWRAIGQDEDALMASFLASEAYERFQEIEASDPGLCIEEAFYTFCLEQGLGDPAVLRQEYLLAAATALAATRDPAFALPSGFREVNGGYLALLPGDPPRVFGAWQGQLITGLVPAQMLPGSPSSRSEPG